MTNQEIHEAAVKLALARTLEDLEREMDENMEMAGRGRWDLLHDRYGTEENYKVFCQALIVKRENGR